MQFRKLLFWLHLILGCLGGLVILTMSFTGVLLTYERQILARVERGAFPVTPGALRLPLEGLLTRVAEQRGPLPASATVVVRSDSASPVELNLGKEGSAFIDPYTGLIMGSPDRQWRGFFQKVTAIHRWLAGEGDWRAVGKAITGASTLAFLGLLLSGLYLWLPRKWTWQHLAPITWFRRGLSGKARDFNWHNVIGFWSVVPLFFVIVSILPIAYPWANQLIYQVTGTSMPKTESAAPPKAASSFSGLDRLWLKAAQQSPGWQSISFRWTAAAPVAFAIDGGDGGQPQLRGTLTLDRETAELVRWESFSDFNTGRQVRMYSRFLHTGEALGIVGQTIAGVASLGGVVMVWTGLALAWRRFLAWRKRRSGEAESDRVIEGRKASEVESRAL